MQKHIQALHAAISRRSWNDVERAANDLRDNTQKRDWAENPEFIQYAQHVIKEVVPNMKDSAVFLTIAPDGGMADVKQAVEIGFCILLDKPIVVIAPPGRHVAPRLLRIADHIITADITTEEGREQMGEQLKAFMNQ